MIFIVLDVSDELVFKILVLVIIIFIILLLCVMVVVFYLRYM